MTVQIALVASLAQSRWLAEMAQLFRLTGRRLRVCTVALFAPFAQALIGLVLAATGGAGWVLAFFPISMLVAGGLIRALGGMWAVDQVRRERRARARQR